MRVETLWTEGPSPVEPDPVTPLFFDRCYVTALSNAARPLGRKAPRS